ncbi:inositol monophosphatase family protein [Microbacterium elymi]|uniref:Inositol monophosphatase n=1 Tax=Microbacterium elymi TaxID=2909587 RepID=A0ABY5NHD8_9MICO|nr:inositol monophosphatase family protein [Microbacterium elymi]UUT34546.1 inositol monophosphatase [Microbacterium elymi]
MTIEATESRRLKDAAATAARAQRDPLRRAFRGEMTLGFKRDARDIVTEYDKATEHALVAQISADVPDSSFLGEEGGATGEGRVRWYIDPIDGTSNFAVGFAFWCVSIAAEVDGQIVAGVVYDPVADILFSADVGGAWLDDRPLRAQGAQTEAEATLITGYPNAREIDAHGDVALERFGALVGAHRALRRPGSATMSVCHVAAGWVDAAAGFSVNPWDVSAAGFILTQAGGVYRAMGGAADAPWHHRPGYVATVAGLKCPTLDAVAEAITG